MPRSSNNSSSRHGHHQARHAVLLAVLVFAALAAVPVLRTALHLAPVRPLTSTGSVRLLPAPKALPAVQVSRVAAPIAGGGLPASAPAVNPAEEAAVVSVEDSRLRVLLHDSIRIYQPQIVSVRGALPTLVLPPGPAGYTAADLVQYGALVMRPHHVGLLIDNVFVTANARLDLGWPRLKALYLDSTAGGFASVVTWGGTLDFSGTASNPLTIMGWDHQLNAPAADRGGGRSYIRAVGGRMEITDARVSSLGFWSGRTGGVAWTGISGRPSRGGARSSTFTDDTYGAFIERGTTIALSADLFEFNQLDGLHIHRYTVGASVTGSSAVRNGGNGFVVDPASEGTVFAGDLAEHNRGNGFLVDSQPLVRGASASGNAVVAGSGTRIKDSAALRNLRDGILVEGGTGTLLQADSVCTPLTGIAVRTGAAGTILTGNDVRCGPRVGVEIGPNASGTVVAGNTIAGARVALLARSIGTLRADSNVISGATLFGITVRGSTSRISGADNVISGTGFRAVDARADASRPALAGTDAAGWLHHVRLTVVNYLQFHPLAALWLSLFMLLLAGGLWSRRKPAPPHPYPASTGRQPDPRRAPRSDPGPDPSPDLLEVIPGIPGPQAAVPQAARERVAAGPAARPQGALRSATPPWPAAAKPGTPWPEASPAGRPDRLVGAAVAAAGERDQLRARAAPATRPAAPYCAPDDPGADDASSTTSPLPRIGGDWDGPQARF
jgi:Right handed beta helix region